MKNFTFWRDALNNAGNILVLKGVGEDIANFQKQTNFLIDETKLNPGQVIGLRNLYSQRVKILTAESRPLRVPGKKNHKNNS